MDLDGVLAEFVENRTIPIFGVANVQGFADALPHRKAAKMHKRCVIIAIAVTVLAALLNGCRPAAPTATSVPPTVVPTPVPPTPTVVPTAAPPAASTSSGGLIAFVSTRDGNGEIYVMNADGSDQRRLTN